MVLTSTKKFNPAPKDLIQLWEAFEYMSFIESKCYEWYHRSKTPVIKMSSSFAHHILSQSCGLLHFLCLLVLLPPLMDGMHLQIGYIRLLLDVSWSNLLSSISCLRSLLGKMKKYVLVFWITSLIYCLMGRVSPGHHYPKVWHVKASR